MIHKQPKRVLITGASGFIGAALMRYYQEQDIPVVGIDLLGDDQNVFRGDVSDPQGFSEILSECDVIIHTAALVSNSISDADMWKVNVLATQRLVQAAVKHSIRRFIHLSSIVVYGNSAVGELDECQPVHGDGGSYVLTKLASEHAVLSIATASDMEVVILRPGDVYGPGSRPWVVLPIEAINKGQFILPAHGEGFFRPVYIDDLIKGIFRAASAAEAAGEIFNLSCKGYTTTKEFFGHHFRWMDKRGPVGVPTNVALIAATAATKIADLTGGVNEASRATVLQLCTKSWFSISKAERLLGWTPEMPFEEGITLSERWARQQGLIS